MPIKKIGETQYYLITFDSAGNECDEEKGKISHQILDDLSSQPITDVFLFSHGWLSDVPAALSQYDKWITAMSKNLADIEQIKQARQKFHPLLIGLHWPSLPWGDENLTSISEVKPLIDRYAQRTVDTETSRRELRTILTAAIKAEIDPPNLPEELCDAYLRLNNEIYLGSTGVAAAPGADREPFNPQKQFKYFKEALSTIFSNRRIDNILQPLRMLSFWKMKDRARQLGETGGFNLLVNLQRVASDNVRFHLMGHSFGCIVVCATLTNVNNYGKVRPVNSLVLAQGALSHWSYCSNIPVAPGLSGYFHSIVADGKVAGSILTTQSELDKALKTMYPIGAGIRRQIRFRPGEFPKYGAVGTFGVRGLENIVDRKMLPLDSQYQFEKGKIYNLESTKYICEGGGLGGAHNDIAKPEVAHAVWQAALSS